MSLPVVAFVTGGTSAEAQVSYKSAETILKHIDRRLFDVHVVDIRPDGWWARTKDVVIPVSREDFSYLNKQGQKIKFDVALIGIHGTPGEDGKLQGYFDMIGLPYTGCDASVSAMTFNKRLAVSAAAFAGVRVPKSILLFAEYGYDIEYLWQQFKYPVFVKPNNGGSSIGISKVLNYKSLKEAIDRAFEHDTQVLIEEMIHGREVTVGAFRHKGYLHILPATEIRPKTAFFDFEAKYQPGMTEEITPAPLSELATEQIRSAVELLYENLNLKGVVRIDFIYNEESQIPYMLEINTVPGQTETSLVPQQLSAYGWSLTQFYTALIQEALGIGSTNRLANK